MLVQVLLLTKKGFLYLVLTRCVVFLFWISGLVGAPLFKDGCCQLS